MINIVKEKPKNFNEYATLNKNQFVKTVELSLHLTHFQHKHFKLKLIFYFSIKKQNCKKDNFFT